MKPPLIGTGHVDLMVNSAEIVHETDAIITANPNHILHANPADCGEIALVGFSPKIDRDVIALVHANRLIVQNGTHLETLRYISQTYGIRPETMHAWLSPSGREGYKFEKIDEAQKAAEAWRGYIEQDDDGFWHVGFHDRTVADLKDFGIPENQTWISPDDTTTNPDYFSHLQHTDPNQRQRLGGNGLMFAIAG